MHDAVLWCYSGALGKRTRFQQKDVVQLVLNVTRGDVAGANKACFGLKLTNIKAFVYMVVYKDKTLHY